MSNNKQTAVEWLRQELLKRDMDISIKELFEQAKEMEKQQIIDAWDNGAFNLIFETSQQYYKQEFGDET